MLEKQNNRCLECGGPGPFIAEHTVPVGLGNEDKPDCLLCRPCAREKTIGKHGDIWRIAKSKRQARITGPQRPGRKKAKIKSAGFRGWRRMDGTLKMKASPSGDST